MTNQLQSPAAAESPTITPELAASFQRQGYLLLRADDLGTRHLVTMTRAQAEQALMPLLPPVEFEADLGYPGSPGGRSRPGGQTPRRLLAACSRFPELRQWATGPTMAALLQPLLPSQLQPLLPSQLQPLLPGQGSHRAMLSQCHHNCIMTKMPGHSSSTNWHQDIRYWSFDRPELVSAWLALGAEDSSNGGLQLLPGSHTLNLDRGRLDADLFLRTDLASNRRLLDQAISISLAPGDLLLFHCRLFHAAGANRSQEPKLSAVFTYHLGNNLPIPDTRSAAFPSLPVPAVAGSSQ